jgi:hypothetical protein
MEHRIARNNEEISAIGVALGIIQDTVEKTILNPTDADLAQVRREAYDAVVRMGADASTIQVTVEVDRQTKRVSATAQGTPELRTRHLGGKLPSDDELRGKASHIMNLSPEQIVMHGGDSWLQIAQGEREKRILFGLLTMLKTPIVVIDREGIVRLQLQDAVIDYTTASEVEGLIQTRLEQLTTYGDAGEVVPDLFIVKPNQIADLTGLVEANQMLSVARIELQSVDANEKVALISCRKY